VSEPFPPPASILIVRLSAIGDVVMASPVAEVLRRTYPEARIAWLAEEGMQGVLEGNPFLDEVIVWEKRAWKDLLKRGRFLALLKEASRLRRSLRERRFDLALDMQGLLKSGILTALSGADIRVGLGSVEGSFLFMTRVVARPAESFRISSQYLHLVQELGFDAGDFRMHVPVGAEETEFLRSFVAENGLDGGYVALAPFTTRPQKHWIEDRWVETARMLAEETGLRSIVLGGPGDAEAAGRIAGACSPGAVAAAGRTTLRQAAALIAGARGFVGVDTGLTHMGIALDVPTVAIFGSTCPYRNTTRDNAVVLYSGEECSPCRRRPTCDGAYHCMKAITADVVAATLISLMPVSHEDPAR